MSPKIFFILTGGTIDSKTKGQERDVLSEHSAVPGFLQSLGPEDNFEFIEMVWKDSRDIDANDRKNLLLLLQQSNCQKIIITHGTFTMAETGRYLQNNLTRKDQVIILTGSFTPLLFQNSDAPANLEYALEQIKILKSGVYLAMSHRVLNPDEAIKDVESGEFYSIYDKQKRNLQQA